MARKYHMGKRAKQRESTRLAIIEAAVRLHERVGPARTTISAIADEAGVRRATVYDHFAGEEQILDACKNHYMNLNPLPDPDSFLSESTPEAMLRRAVDELYRYHERTEGMMANVLRDADVVPGMAANLEGYYGYFGQVADGLTGTRRAAEEERLELRAAIGHALSFHTWRSLVRRQGLSHSEAVSLMLLFVRAVGECPPPAAEAEAASG